MTELSPDISAIARKNESFILQRLAEVGQARVAELTGLSESTVSRMKDGQIKNVCLLIAALSGQAVPVDSVVYSKDQINAVEILAYEYLRAKLGRS